MLQINELPYMSMLVGLDFLWSTVAGHCPLLIARCSFSIYFGLPLPVCLYIHTDYLLSSLRTPFIRRGFMRSLHTFYLYQLWFLMRHLQTKLVLYQLLNEMRLAQFHCYNGWCHCRFKVPIWMQWNSGTFWITNGIIRKIIERKYFYHELTNYIRIKFVNSW